jgi:3-isopropylmalate/(R)-2-methylmalate dehydratase large subunit
MEGRMTVCNLSIEMGARGGMIAPDQTTLIIRRTFICPKRRCLGTASYWKTLKQMQMQNLMKKSTFLTLNQ